MFSERETKVLRIIGTREKSIQQIAASLFDADDMPMDSNILVSNCVNRIIKKCKFNELEWTLEKRRAGNTIAVKRVG